MTAGEAYTALDLAEIMGTTAMTISRRSRKEKWPFIKKSGRGGGKLFPIDTLPADVQSKILAGQESPTPAYNDEEKPIPDRARQTGLARLELFTAWQKMRNKARSKAKADKDFLHAYNTGISHPDIYQILGEISRTSLFRWSRRLEESEGDYRILCDHRGWAQATGIQGDLGPEAERLFCKAYLTEQQPSVALAYRTMAASLEKQGLPAPSLRSTHRFLERYVKDNYDLVVLMREGEKAYQDKVGPYITRDSSLLEVGDVLVADGHRLNFEILHPDTGRPARMTLILWFDWASRFPVGWEIMPEENTVAISSALFMAIKHLGKIPKAVYLDNGKAFRARYFTQASEERLPMELTGLYSRLGINVQFAKAYRGRSKPVERFFGTFNEQCQRLLPSYTGASIDDKPAHLHRNEKWHKARHRNLVPTVEQALAVWREYVGWHVKQPHRGLKGKTPLEVFAAGRGPGVDLDKLAWEFLWRKEVKPARCRVKLAGVFYESDALHGLKQPLLAMYQWADMREIRLYTLAGREYLGVARPVEAVNPLARYLGDDLDLLKIQAANKRVARLKKQTLQLAEEVGAGPEALESLPWMQRGETAALPPQSESPAPPSTEQMSETERRQIEAAQAAWEARKAARPAYERPHFNNPLDRYSYLFNLQTFEGVELVEEDRAFMAGYEQSPEFKITRRRFEQLRRLKESQAEMEAAQ